MKGLPKFTNQPLEKVTRFAAQMFTHPNQPEITYFRRIITYDDGHFGAIFNLDYFEKTETPTRSQWNSLKKKFKRHDKRVFVLKEQSIVACDADNDLPLCGQIEFGFLQELSSS